MKKIKLSFIKLSSIFLILLGLSSFSVYKTFKYLIEFDKKQEINHCQNIVLITWLYTNDKVYKTDKEIEDVLNNLYKGLCK